MNQPSSSISSSDVQPTTRRGAALWTVLWTIVGVVALDILANIAFAYPSDPKATSASQLQLYFDYGRSTEGRLRRITRANPADTAPITLAGWYEPLVVGEPKSAAGKQIVTFYGMSHAMRLAEALDRTSDRYRARTVGAPGATANWSYGAFRRDTGLRKGDTAVLALMSANLPMITTMSAMTWNVSFPMPYTDDRFSVRNGKLSAVAPPYASFADYVRTLNSPTEWAAAQRVFAANDPLYDPILMQETVLDHSTFVRLARRAYGQYITRQIRGSILNSTGYVADSEQVRVANALIDSFASQARSRGIVPVVFLVNNFGDSDHLYQAVCGTMRRNGISVLSSHRLVSPRDPRGYLPDSHFTDDNDDRLARALVRVIEDDDRPGVSPGSTKSYADCRS